MFIAAGGTGGHIFPGIAIADEIRRRDPSIDITFAGTARGLESSLLPKLGWPLMLMGSHSIKDKGLLGKIFALLRLPFSVLRATLVLAVERPVLVVGIGGYAAAPLVFAAWIVRVPVVLVEPNAIAGMTNRKLGRLAKRVFVAFDEARKYFADGKAVVTGVPIRSEVLEAKRASGKTGETKTLFVFGGSQGAMKLNNAMSAAAEKLSGMGRKINIIHQTGGSIDPAEMEAAYAKSGIEAEVMTFCDRIWDCYGKADLVIARSGANTVAELSALGIPSILVPYPYAADDHQRANAMALVRSGGSRMVDDGDCDGARMALEIEGLLKDAGKLTRMAQGAASLGKPDAAARIAGECIGIIESKR
jgi:UDP-N-acetylglucosamine--N-acetylmuramyl-(pentapeptide) pyrophosphoryl-undecaprenol N-acetylglucosamine transferase